MRTHPSQKLPRLLPLIKLQPDVPDIIMRRLDQLHDKESQARIITHRVDLHHVLRDVLDG